MDESKVRNFAERVNRLCDKLIEHMPEDTADRRALQDLQESAVDISQGDLGMIEDALVGIADALKVPV